MPAPPSSRALSLRRAGRRSGTGYYRFPAIRGGRRLLGRGEFSAGRPDGRRRVAPHQPSRERVVSGNLDGRDDARFLRRLRGSDRGLHDVARRRHAGPPHVRRRRPRRGLRAGRRARLCDEAVQHAARHAARSSRPDDGRAYAGPLGTGLGRLLDSGQAARSSSRVSRSKAATPRAIAAARRRPSGKWPEAEALPLSGDYAGTSKTPMWWNHRVYFLSDRDGTMNVWSMDEDGHDLRQHASQRLGRGPGVAVGRPDRRQTGRRSAPARPLQRHGLGARDPSLLRLRPAARGVGEEADGVPVLDRALPQGRPRGAHRPRAGVRRAGEAGAARRGHAQGRRRYRRGHLPAGREGTRRALGRVRGGRALEALRERGRRARTDDPRRQGPALGRRCLRPTADGSLTTTRTVTSGSGARRRKPTGSSPRLAGGRPRPRVVARQPVARLHRAGRKRLRPGVPARPRGLDDDGRDHQSLRQLERRVEPRRRVALLPLGPEPEHRRALALGPSPARPFPRSPTELYAVALKKGGRFPFAPPDELHPDEPKKEAAKKEEKKPKATEHAGAAEKSAKPVVIDLEGLSARLFRVPVAAGRLHALRTDGHRLYWLSTDNTSSRRPGCRPSPSSARSRR